MALLFGGLSFPLTAQAAGASVVPVADPFLNKALPYWQTCLNTYLESAYAAAMAGRAMGTTQRACRSAIPVDPLPWLDTGLILEPPLLACYPVKGPSTRLTMQRDRVDFNYRLTYVLPALDWTTYVKIAPILQAAYALLIKVTEEQHDAAYNSGERIWDTAGLTMLRIDNAEFGALDRPGTAGHFMPSFVADVTVEIRDDYDPSSGSTLSGMDVNVDEGTGDGSLLVDAVQGSTDVG